MKNLIFPNQFTGQFLKFNALGWLSAAIFPNGGAAVNTNLGFGINCKGSLIL